MRYSLLFAALIAATIGLLSCRASAPAAAPVARRAPRPLPTPVRAVWVARFHYHSPDDVRSIIANCARAGFNTVLWQVRGEATVAYPSGLEPWSREYDFRDPGFDPLGLAVHESHRHGMRIEAWVNVMPGWKGTAAPPIPTQIYHARPNWFMHDAVGRRQPLGDFYVILNPCLPEVRRHIVAVVEEIVANYNVDGVHLDYVRYAWDGVPDAKRSYPRDRRTLALYHRATGKRPNDDLRAWDHWRANQLTRLVAEIRAEITRRRPGVALTAAVWRDPRRGYNEYLQNSVAWLRSGLIDAAMPMAYTDDADLLASEIDTYRELAPGGRIVPGLGIYKHEQPRQMQAQLSRCRAWGGDFSLFSYESLFPTTSDQQASVEHGQAKQRLREQRRAVLAEFVQG